MAFEKGGDCVAVAVGVLEATEVGVFVGVRLDPVVGVKDGVTVGPLDVWITSWGALAPSRLEKLIWYYCLYQTRRGWETQGEQKSFVHQNKDN